VPHIVTARDLVRTDVPAAGTLTASPHTITI
jgi:hypothetical protein